MKKVICILLILTAIMLTSCSNRSLGPGNYQFTKIHIETLHYSGCIEIKKWYESSPGVEVKTKDFGNMFLSEGTYIMIEDKCPICEGETDD